MVLIGALVGGFYAVFYPDTRANGTLESGGRLREYLLHVPEGHDPTLPVPLVVSLHGAMQWPGAQMETSGWNDVADRHGFLVVYPSGLNMRGKGTGMSPKVWFMEPDAIMTADLDFIAALIDTVAARYAVDSTRVYLSGFSNGGGMAFGVSCRMPERFAAVGTVAAAQIWSWDDCGDSTPVPMVAFHGTADRLVPYGGAGPSALAPGGFPSVSSWVEGWAQRNRCAPEPSESPIDTDVTRIEYGDCDADAPVVLYRLEGVGHQWPGGTPFPTWLTGPTTDAMNVSEVMWAFFSGYPTRP